MRIKDTFTHRMELFFYSVVLFFIATYSTHAGTLTCSITTAAGCTGVVMLRMSSSTNAHAELATGTTLGYASSVICCSNVPGLSNVCSGTNQIIVRLASKTNAHVQDNNQSGYTNNACISVGVGGAVSLGYQSTNCSGYDTTLASIASTSNSHIGGPSSYTTKICATAQATQALTFSISSNIISFGQVTPTNVMYASSTANGSLTETQAHTVSVATNAPSGYIITVKGATLTSQQNTQYTITQIGATATTSSPGTEQFGIRGVVTSGTGLVSSPYNSSLFAYTATATTTSTFATGTGDASTTVYSLRYLVNVAPSTENGTYSANLVYVATANF